MTLAEFDLVKRGSVNIWISNRFADPAFVDLLAEPDRLFADSGCRIIKDQRKIKIGRVLQTINGVPRCLYVKRYNTFSLRFRLLSPLFRSGALRSLRGAHVLLGGKIATAEPIAAVESRFFGMLRYSFFVSEEIAGGKTADVYWLESARLQEGGGGFKARRAFLRVLASLFRSLHEQRIYHNDLKDRNIIVVNENAESIKCFLLDLEGVRLCSRLSQRRRTKNLVQLYRTLGRYVPGSGRIFFLKCYLGVFFEDRKVKRKIIEGVLSAARRVNLTKARTPQSDNFA